MIIPNPNFYPRHWKDEIAPNSVAPLQVVEPAYQPVRTGLLDQYGNPLMRTPEARRIGFLPDHSQAGIAAPVSTGQPKAQQK